MNLKGLLGKIHRSVKGRLAARGKNATGGIPEFCLHRYPHADGRSPCLVVFYSGDGGWARLTTHLAEQLQRDGLAVTGIDSMHYFWHERAAEAAAEDLATLIEEAKDTKVILLGYSMGADVLPAIATRLPPEILDRIAHLVLLSPSQRGHLKFRLIGWLGFHTPHHHGYTLLPEIEKLSPMVPISCMAGEKEKHTLLSVLDDKLARIDLLPGGHHYNSDYETLANRVLAHLQDALPGSPTQ